MNQNQKLTQCAKEILRRSTGIELASIEEILTRHRAFEESKQSDMTDFQINVLEDARRSGEQIREAINSLKRLKAERENAHKHHPSCACYQFPPLVCNCICNQEHQGIGHTQPTPPDIAKIAEHAGNDCAIQLCNRGCILATDIGHETKYIGGKIQSAITEATAQLVKERDAAVVECNQNWAAKLFEIGVAFDPAQAAWIKVDYKEERDQLRAELAEANNNLQYAKQFQPHYDVAVEWLKAHGHHDKLGNAVNEVCRLLDEAITKAANLTTKDLKQ